MPLGHQQAGAPPASGPVTGPGGAAGPGAGSAPTARWADVPRGDAATLVLAFGLLVAWSPALHSGLVTPRLALLALALGPGLVVVAGLVRRADGAARLAAGYLAWALVAALASGAPRIATLGSYGSDLGWVYLAGAIGAWGLGRRLGPWGRRRLPAVLLVGLAANAVMGVLEAALDPDGLLATESGRVLGLTPNCLYLGGLLAGGLALVAALRPGRRSHQAVAIGAVALFAAGANLSGSRGALVGGVVLALAASVIGSGRREPAGAPDGDAPGGRRLAVPPAVARALVVGLAVVVGVLASVPLQDGGTAGTERLETASGGFQPRLTMWGAGLEASAERPLTGWGPGRFRSATASRTTAAFARAEGPDRLFFDAHNLFVEHLTTTGIPGLALLVGFAWAAARRAQGPLAWFAAGVAVTWLLTPVSVSTGPIALLALGAAARAPVAAPAATVARRTWRVGSLAVGRSVGAVLAVVGLVVAADLVASDVLLKAAVADADLDGVRRVERLRPPDAVLADVEASARSLVATEDPSPANHAAAVRAAERTVALDPTRETWWVNLGYTQAQSGPGTEDDRLDAAEASFREALARSPWSVEAMVGLARVADARGDEAAGDRWRDRSCLVLDCGEAPAP